jgi:hypothetical protein
VKEKEKRMGWWYTKDVFRKGEDGMHGSSKGREIEHLAVTST